MTIQLNETCVSQGGGTQRVWVETVSLSSFLSYFIVFLDTMSFIGDEFVESTSLGPNYFIELISVVFYRVSAHNEF